MMAQNEISSIKLCKHTIKNNIELIQEFVAIADAFLQNYQICEEADFEKMGEAIHKLKMLYTSPSDITWADEDGNEYPF